ncbi:hypothetical protein SAMN05660330_04126 [Desulforhopalus singaporensis]|uniref:Transposase n=1 Tax=Desulforhopalus singaporensis TaxID=91360 RepID=A0A1H0VLF0_9BACT|nr:hypothetical protein SAMN05660330_04126 [Desulforhopalus singaporensis]
MAEDCKEIKKLAKKKENAEIFFGDESTVRSDYHSLTTTSAWDLYKKIMKVMRSLQRRPETVKSFFQHPWTKYSLVSTD